MRASHYHLEFWLSLENGIGVLVLHTLPVQECYSVVIYQQVLDRGVGLSTKSDSELITQMLSQLPPRGEKTGPDWGARIRHLMEATPTAYSLVMLHGDTVYGIRDPFGNRPLCIGRLMPVGDVNGKHSKMKKTFSQIYFREA